MEFDSIHGRWPHVGRHDAGSLTLGGQRIPLMAEQRIEDLPLNGIDMLIDATGVFKSAAKIAPYYAAGVQKVVVSAPVKDGDALNIVYGINHHLYTGQRLVTAASCTTNCLAPMVKVIHEALTIRHGAITTIHDVTNTQTIVDRPAKDMRRARSALLNLIPTSTGSATAITLIYPDLKGRLNGHAVRVPLLNASLTDAVFEVETPTTAEAVNALFRAYAKAERVTMDVGFYCMANAAGRRAGTLLSGVSYQWGGPAPLSRHRRPDGGGKRSRRPPPAADRGGAVADD